jgi:hypothetical protein
MLIKMHQSEILKPHLLSSALRAQRASAHCVRDTWLYTAGPEILLQCSCGWLGTDPKSLSNPTKSLSNPAASTTTGPISLASSLYLSLPPSAAIARSSDVPDAALLVAVPSPSSTPTRPSSNTRSLRKHMLPLSASFAAAQPPRTCSPCRSQAGATAMPPPRCCTLSAGCRMRLWRRPCLCAYSNPACELRSVSCSPSRATSSSDTVHSPPSGSHRPTRLLLRQLDQPRLHPLPLTSFSRRRNTQLHWPRYSSPGRHDVSLLDPTIMSCTGVSRLLKTPTADAPRSDFGMLAPLPRLTSTLYGRYEADQAYLLLKTALQALSLPRLRSLPSANRCYLTVLEPQSLHGKLDDFILFIISTGHMMSGRLEVHLELVPGCNDGRFPNCHTQFWKANQMRTMYVPGSELTYTAIT